jgi:hypothetical protein
MIPHNPPKGPTSIDLATLLSAQDSADRLKAIQAAEQNSVNLLNTVTSYQSSQITGDNRRETLLTDVVNLLSSLLAKQPASAAALPTPTISSFTVAAGLQGTTTAGYTRIQATFSGLGGSMSVAGAGAIPVSENYSNEFYHGGAPLPFFTFLSGASGTWVIHQYV